MPLKAGSGDRTYLCNDMYQKPKNTSRRKGIGKIICVTVLLLLNCSILFQDWK